DRNRSHWSTSKTPSYTKSVSWQHHLRHIDKLQGYDVFNLGTGNGVSVLQVIDAFEKASDKKVNYEIVARREGDIGSSWADVSKAERVLGWKAKYNIEDMMAHTWNWQKQNPNGYGS
ncbi:GDP-mannose 4,6-dehydratase, partial [Escherichia coli]